MDKALNKDQYFKIRKDKQEWLGIRYFRFNYAATKTIQVCEYTGEVKKGKSNTYGVYLIHPLTFLSNYLAMGYAEPVTKGEYNKAFKRVFKNLTYNQ